MSKYAIEDIALGYAPVPPEMLFYRPKVTEAEMKTWCAFALHRDLATGETHVGAMTVAAILGVDRTTVGRAIEGLKTKGFLLDLGRERDPDTGRLGYRKFAVAVGGKRVKVGLVRDEEQAEEEPDEGAETHDADLPHGDTERAPVHKSHDAAHDASHEASHDASHDATVHKPILIEEDLRGSKENEDPSGGAAPTADDSADAQMHENPEEAGPAEPPPPTGGMYVRVFDEYVAEVRAAWPQRERKSVSGKWRKNLKRSADRELEDGRDPELIEKGVKRLALRIDEFPRMELAEAINDVLDGEPWAIEQERGFARRGSARSAGEATPTREQRAAERRRQMREMGLLKGEDEAKPA